MLKILDGATYEKDIFSANSYDSFIVGRTK